MDKFLYTCNECGKEWVTDGDRPKCPKCRSEDWVWEAKIEKEEEVNYEIY